MKVTEALEYLLETDEPFGQLKGLIDGLEFRIKTAEAQGFINAEGTQDLRKSLARTSTSYKELTKEYEDSKIEFHTIQAKRKTAELHIEVWRSQSANKRTGNI